MRYSSFLVAFMLLSSGLYHKLVGKDFVNLDFNHPQTGNVQVLTDPPGTYGIASDLLPGWTLYEENKVYTGLVGYFAAPFPGQLRDQVQFGLAGEPGTSEWNIEYLVDLRIDIDGTFVYPPVAISQVGLIPDNAWYLTVRGGPHISVNGTPLISEIIDSSTRRWDVSAFAGREVKLRLDFTSTSGTDIIGFTTPEPSIPALMICGTAFAWCLFRFSNDGNRKSGPKSPGIIDL